MQDLVRIVHREDHTSMVVNAKGERLFESWNKFMNGSPMDNVAIYTFDHTNMNTDDNWLVSSLFLSSFNLLFVGQINGHGLDQIHVEWEMPQECARIGEVNQDMIRDRLLASEVLYHKEYRLIYPFRRRSNDLWSPQYEMRLQIGRVVCWGTVKWRVW